MRPVLFQIGSLPVRSYGALMAVAFIVGIWIARRRAAARGLNPDIIIDLSVFVILASVLGARAAYVFVRWEYFSANLAAIFRVWEGGLAQYGGFFAGTVAGLLFFRSRRVDIWKGADLMVPSLAAGVAIGRLGCFMNGCCFGKPCDLPWAVAFGDHSIAAVHGFGQMHVHPTQIYEALIAVVVLLVVLAVERRKLFDGFLLWFFVILLSVSRFLIDPLRYYESSSIALESGGLMLTNNQAVGLGLVLLSLGFMLYLWKRSRQSLPGS